MIVSGYNLSVADPGRGGGGGCPPIFSKYFKKSTQLAKIYKTPGAPFFSNTGSATVYSFQNFIIIYIAELIFKAESANVISREIFKLDNILCLNNENKIDCNSQKFTKR